jgi:hypothetical protein
MAEPPLLLGADQVKAIWALPGVPPNEVGAPGIVRGVTADEAEDAALLPMLLVANTVKVYGVPLVRLDTTQFVVAPFGVVQVAPPGEAVAVYETSGSPPSATDAVQLTVTWPLPATPDTEVGALGTVEAESGVTPADATDAGPVPAALVAVTVKVYSTPLVRLDTWQLVLAVLQKAPPGAAVAV